MNCERFRDRLDDFAVGQLDPDERRELAAHVNACAECAELVRRRRRPPRLVAAGFLGAFAASIFTLIYTGLNVGDVDSADDAEPPASPERPEREPRGAPAVRGETRADSRDADAARADAGAGAGSVRSRDADR